MADIGSIKPVEQILEILHPGNKTPLGISVGLVSLDDEKMKAIKRHIIDRNTQVSMRNKPIDATLQEKNLNVICFSAILYWEWNDNEFKGEKNPTLSKEKALEIFEELPWFRKQIEEKISETESFFIGSNAS